MKLANIIAEIDNLNPTLKKSRWIVLLFVPKDLRVPINWVLSIIKINITDKILNDATKTMITKNIITFLSSNFSQSNIWIYFELVDSINSSNDEIFFNLS